MGISIKSFILYIKKRKKKKQEKQETKLFLENVLSREKHKTLQK